MSPTLATRANSAASRLGIDTRIDAMLTAIHPRFRRDRRDNDNLGLVLSANLRPDSNTVDIGANQGDVLRRLVELAPKGRHFAFEPLPELAGKLRAEFPSATIHDVALTDTVGTDSFVRALGSEGYSKLGAAPNHGRAETFEVRTTTLDATLPAETPIDFIKIDTEGSELFVVRGASKTLNRWRPTLWIEHGRTTNGYRGTRSVDLWDVLCTEHGYRVFTADGTGPLARDQLQPGGLPGMMWNWLAVPNSRKNSNPGSHS